MTKLASERPVSRTEVRRGRHRVFSAVVFRRESGPGPTTRFRDFRIRPPRRAVPFFAASAHGPAYGCGPKPAVAPFDKRKISAAEPTKRTRRRGDGETARRAGTPAIRLAESEFSGILALFSYLYGVSNRAAAVVGRPYNNRKTMEEKKTYRVLFVCLGNICRSPSAEAVFRGAVERAGLEDRIEIDSAGISGYHAGESADSRMTRHAARRGYRLTSISRPVTTEDFDRFDLIVGMDDSNIRDLMRKAPREDVRAEIRRMTDFCTQYDDTEVPDPYYGGAAGFERVLDLLEDACRGLLDHVRSCIDRS